MAVLDIAHDRSNFTPSLLPLLVPPPWGTTKIAADHGYSLSIEQLTGRPIKGSSTMRAPPAEKQMIVTNAVLSISYVSKVEPFVALRRTWGIG